MTTTLGVQALRGTSAISGAGAPAASPLVDFIPRVGQSGDAAAPSFADLLQNSLQSTATQHQQADSLVARSIQGEDVTEVEVLSAVKKADLSMRLLLQVRNQLLQAYDEIKQMQM